MKYRFFDSASTTKCCSAAAAVVQHFLTEEFGNPSSAHTLGQQSAKKIREARQFFASTFRIDPPQVVFTGGGTEADNMAITGVALAALERFQGPKSTTGKPHRVLVSATEHPAIKKTAQSLTGLGFDVHLLPVDEEGQIQRSELDRLLTPETLLVSIQQVNNITGAVHPVESLAEYVKSRCPGSLFHTDAVQAFGKVPHPTAPSKVDLVSISAHKIKGPKGVGALIILNKKLLTSGLRPLIWGGEQEGGMRSGTQNAGLIAGFAIAAQETLEKRDSTVSLMKRLQTRFREQLSEQGLRNRINWNSPDEAAPHIISLCAPSYPVGPLTKLLEERGYIVSTGSACSSAKAAPDAVLGAMGVPPMCAESSIRVSLHEGITTEDVDGLAKAFKESMELMDQLLGSSSSRRA